MTMKVNPANSPNELFGGKSGTAAAQSPSAAEIRQRQHLVQVALGKHPADLVIRGGKLVNVYTGEMLDDVDIAIAGERIALVGDASPCIGPDTEIVDVEGAYLTPGFVDAHYHIESSRLAPWRHAEITLPRGLTSLVEDPHEACAPGGLDAIRYFLGNTQGLPQKLYVQVPSATPPTNVETTGGYIGGDEFKQALEWHRVTGLGEVMDPPRIFGNDARTWSLIQAAISAGQPIEGHGGFSGNRLAAYASAGVQSTHSPNTPEQALEMLRQGFTIQLKAERETKTIEKLLESRVDWSRIGLAVDDRPVEKLLELGSLDHEVRLAIELGIPPVRAYQMATINNARHWRLDRDIGGIAPGRYADILVVSDLEKVVIERVFANGKEVARNGKLLIPLEGPGQPSRHAPGYALNTVRLQRKVTADDFKVGAPVEITCSRGQERVWVYALVIPPFYFSDDLEAITCKLPVRNGFVEPVPGTGVNKVAIVERHRGTGNIGLGFWRWGFQRGAVAMSVLHDSHNISVVGANDHDMAVAVNRVAEIQGGIVVVENGRILAELPLPIFGLMSDAPPKEVAELSRAVEKAAACLRESAATEAHAGEGEKARGGAAMSQIPPDLAKTMESKPVDVLTFAYLTCHPRRFVLTDQGVFDIKIEKPLPLVW